MLAAVVTYGVLVIATQPLFAELFGARVRYTSFATVAGFSPLISVALLDLGGPYLVAAFLFVAFLFSRETKDVDIGEPDSAQEEFVAQPEPVLSR